MASPEHAESYPHLLGISEDSQVRAGFMGPGHSNATGLPLYKQETRYATQNSSSAALPTQSAPVFKGASQD